MEAPKKSSLEVVSSILVSALPSWNTVDVEGKKPFNEFLKIVQKIPLSGYSTTLANEKVYEFYNTSTTNKDVLIAFLTSFKFKVLEQGLDWKKLLQTMDSVLDIRSELTGEEKDEEDAKESSSLDALVLVSAMISFNSDLLNKVISQDQND